MQENKAEMTIEIGRTLLKKSFDALVLLGCIMFTFYQIYCCLVKYENYPKGTVMEFQTMDQIGNDFPAITFCSKRDGSMERYFGFNESRLKDCYGYHIYNGYI